MTFNEAIAHAKEVAASKCDKCANEHQQLAEWLQELSAYKDKTYITEDFLIRNGFEKHEVDKPDHEFANLCRDRDYYLYCDDCVEISAELQNEEAGIWAIEITFLDYGNSDELNICIIGQLRMFLAIEGLNEVVKQLK